LRRDNALKRFEVVTCVDVPVLCYRLRSFPTVIEVFRIEIFRSCYPVISNSFSRPVPVPKKIGAGTVGSRSRSKKNGAGTIEVFSTVHIPRKRRSSFSPSPAAPPPQLRPAPAMESEKATSADQSWQAPLPAYVRNGVKPSRLRAAVVVFDEMHHRFRHDEAQLRTWADLPPPPADTRPG
jgi:hypothetical protein